MNTSPWNKDRICQTAASVHGQVSPENTTDLAVLYGENPQSGCYCSPSEPETHHR